MIIKKSTSKSRRAASIQECTVGGKGENLYRMVREHHTLRWNFSKGLKEVRDGRKREGEECSRQRRACWKAPRRTILSLV